MAKIVPFTKLPSQARRHALGGFVDDGDLLEFPRPKDLQAQTHEQSRSQPALPKSVFETDWTNQELADLYRAHSLVQSAHPGLECDRGVSDEGDPWFLIGDDTGDVLVHICRIDGTYILDSVALSKALKGANFNALIEDFLNNAVGEHARDAEGADSLDGPANVVRLTRGGTVCLHPSVMIAALVWTLLMRADELSLPASNDSVLEGPDPDQGHDRGQGIAQSNSDTFEDALPATDVPAALREDSGELEEADAGAGKSSNDLSAIKVIAQRDEKQLHVSASSHALTTIAIAAGFYVSAEVADAFGKPFMEAPVDASVILDKSQASETSDPTTSSDHLSDALALLSSVVDLLVVENHEDYAAESGSTGSESTDALTSIAMEAIEAMETNSGQQLLTKSSEVSKALAKVSEAKMADMPAQETSELENVVQPDMAESPDDKGSSMSSEEQTSSAPTGSSSTGSSVQEITQVYGVSHDLDVSHFDTSSFASGLGKFNGELQRYSEALDREAFLPEEDGTTDLEAGGTLSGSSLIGEFDDAARDFISSKLANESFEVLAFKQEVIFMDNSVTPDDSATISWQLEDGGMVSIVGLPSDMGEFLAA